MKRQITLAAMFLFLIAGVAAGCKKEVGEARPLKKKIAGKWQIAKLEVITAGEAPVITTGTSADYIEFKDNVEDQIEMNLGATHALGSYVVLANDDFNIVLPGKLLNCVTNTINDTQLEFTGTVNGASPGVTEKYTLTR